MALTQHWQLDDNAASTTVVATVGTNATLEGGDNTSVLHDTSTPGGSITASLHLNGTDDKIDISGAGVTFGNNTAWSFSIWFKADVTTGTPSIWTPLATQAGSIYRGSDTVIRYQTPGAVDFSWTVSAMGTANWHHLLVTCTAGRAMRVFLDGTESSTGTQTPANTSITPVRIGGRSAAGFWDGFFAWAKVFNSDESANVATLYAEGVTSGGAVIPVFMNQYRQRGN